MIPEIGHFALILALLLALLLGSVPLLGAQRHRADWMALARPLALAQSVCVVLAWACLVLSFMQDDFSVRNVAENSNSMLPAMYRFTAAWGSHEGSMLLWVLMQSLWTLAVALLGRHWPAPVQARVLGVLGLLTAAFTVFVLAASNPFLRLFPVPAQGRDLNPLLQDPGMVFHPPLLYMGYVGFSVAFAFAMAALLAPRADAEWARRARPWTAAAWSFLTLGVLLGSWWAYYELGWGGWWFWDPVENAALMPWLLGTALLHALALSDRRGLFMPWTVLLAILCFALSLLGTFLVRSGVLTSVHAFAMDPRRGIFILALLLAVVGGSLTLFALRAGRMGSAQRFDAISRESLLLANTCLLTVAAATVLLGTFYPLLVEVLGLGRLSVGPPYFDTVFVPIMAPAVFLMGIAPLARWRSAPLPELWRRLRWALVPGLLLGITLPFVGGRWSPLVAVGLFLAVWLALATVIAVVDRLRALPATGWRRLSQACAGLVGHAPGAPGRGGVRGRRDGGARLPDRSRRADDPWQHGRGRRVAVALRRCRAGGGAELRRATRPVRTAAPGPGGRRAAAGKARLSVDAGFADDRGRDPQRLARRRLHRAGRACRAGCLDGAHLSQALRHLDLGRLRADGAGRCVRAAGPALSRRAPTAHVARPRRHPGLSQPRRALVPSRVGKA